MSQNLTVKYQAAIFKKKNIHSKANTYYRFSLNKNSDTMEIRIILTV